MNRLNIKNIIAEELNIKETQVEAVIKLIDDGNTIPFIARYRKEVTGGLTDEVLRNLDERLIYLRNLEKRKEEVTKSIEEQGKLTKEIADALEQAKILAEVEDIYRPYKPKKKTKATIAKAKGLEPLANIILEQKETKTIEEIAKKFVGVAEIEKQHEKRYNDLLKNVKTKKVFSKPQKETWICLNCGNIINSSTKAPEKCPVCDHPKSYYQVHKINY